jgi:DNA-binding NtrC family response regulator
MDQKVLIVDGDPLSLAYHANTLSRHFRLETACGAAKALERLRRDGPFAVVVSDLFLPSSGGRSFLAKVRRLCPDIVHIVLAANPTPETVMNAINNNNVFGFFSKSAPPAQLIRKIRAALELHRQQAGLILPYDRNVLTMEERSFLSELAGSRPC